MRKSWLALTLAILCILILKFFLLTNLEPILDEKTYLSSAKAYLDGQIDPNFQHPPLGKELLAAGILLFGNNAFGLRIVPIIVGLVTLLFTYLIAKLLFGNYKAGLISGAILASETFFFTYSSLAYLEIILTSFSLISIFFLVKYLNKGSPASFFLHTIFLSAAISTKLTGLFLAPASLLLIYIIKKEKIVNLLGKAAIIGIILSIFYLSTYLPLISLKGFGEFLEVQKKMIEFQTSQTFEKHELSGKIDALEYHPIGWFLGIGTIFHVRDGQFKSLSYHPIDLGENYSSLVLFIVNPFVLWPALVALFATAKNFQKSNTAKILTGLSIFLIIPYFLSGRIVYPYYLLSSLPIFSILITYVIYPLWRKHNERWKAIWFLGCCFLFFLLMLPLLIGVKTPSWYYSWFFHP